MRSAGDVGVDATQRLELVFWVLSKHLLRGTKAKSNTLPGSKSIHSGVAKVPVYLLTPGETCRGGVFLVEQETPSRISRSSRTLVPCAGATKLNPKRKVKIVCMTNPSQHNIKTTGDTSLPHRIDDRLI